MKKVTLVRMSDDGVQTLGAMTIEGDAFGCKTLELPYKGNTQMISCIPKGKYICKWTWSNSMKRNMYLVSGVPDRAGVRIHGANFPGQLRGCIALGSVHKDINMDKRADLAHSGATVKYFEELMKGEDFELNII